MKTMAKTHCPHTGLSRPECCCRRCCTELLHRYAPELAGKLSASGKAARK